MKAHIKTFGCQMNKLDSALVTVALAENGFSMTEHVKEADVVLINTCSVREHAEQRVISHIGHLKHIKKSKPDLVVGIIGCMAQRLGEKLLEHDSVDIVCGAGQIADIPQLVKKAINNKSLRGPKGRGNLEDSERARLLRSARNDSIKENAFVQITESIRQTDPENPALEDFESVYDRSDKDIPGQAFVRVMRGCDNFCTYCIVPYVRGPEISRPVDKIIEQVKRLADDGVKLITLLGQAVNKYQYVGDKTYTLAGLLYKVSEINGIEWIRFVTSYPQKEGFKELMQAMRDLPKVCNYLHIPAQSGSDSVLKAMNRHYDSGEYLELLRQAREIVPDIDIAGDFIVGFPGETEHDLEETAELIKQARYKNCFVFKYSPRPGTTSDNRLEDNVPLEVKKQRNYRLLEVQEKISGELAQGFLSKKVKVLVEGLSKKPHLNSDEHQGNPQLIARTAGDWIVVFNGPVSLAGGFANVKITKASPLTLFGELIK